MKAELPRLGRPTSKAGHSGSYFHSFIHSYILQANEQNIKISIKQTQTQPQYSMPHSRRGVVTPLTRDQKIKIHICIITLESLRTRGKAVQLIKPFQ